MLLRSLFVCPAGHGHTSAKHRTYGAIPGDTRSGNPRRHDLQSVSATCLGAADGNRSGPGYDSGGASGTGGHTIADLIADHGPCSGRQLTGLPRTHGTGRIAVSAGWEPAGRWRVPDRRRRRPGPPQVPTLVDAQPAGLVPVVVDLVVPCTEA